MSSRTQGQLRVLIADGPDARLEQVAGTVAALGHAVVAREHSLANVASLTAAEHPDVADNAVIGVPDEDYGGRLAAFVVPKQGADLDSAELRDYLKDKVSRYEQPRDIEIVTEIPRNPAGKVQRKELKT